MKSLILLVGTALLSMFTSVPSNNQKIDNIPKDSITRNTASSDTIKVTLGINPVTHTLNAPQDTKIILATEPITSDWAKYLLPIFTLLLGIGINRIIDWRNSLKTINRTGERWLIEIRSVEQPIKDQVEELLEFKEKLLTQDFVPPTLSIMTAINGEVFKSLDKNEFLKYIVRNHSTKWFEFKGHDQVRKDEIFAKTIRSSNRTHGFVSILTHLFLMIQERYQAYLNGTSKHTSSFTKNLQIFMAENRKFSLSFETAGIDLAADPMTQPIYALFMQFIQPHLKDGKYNPFELRDNFFMPLILHLAQYRLDPRTIPLASAITSCLNDIAGLQMERTYMCENIDIIVRRYREHLADMQPLIAEIKNL